MVYKARTTRAEGWPLLKELRLQALADPVASVAFHDRYETVAAYPDSTWQQRAAAGEGHGNGATFVGETPEGRWGGMVVVLLKADRYAHIVGVYVRPEHRGTGLATQLFEAAAEWAWARPGIRGLRLCVHKDNSRAEAFYRRQGFRTIGMTDPDPQGSGFLAYEMELARPQ